MADANATPAPITQTRSFPPGLVPVAVMLAVAAGLLSLLPSLAQAVWEVPHLFVLGLVISYGVFTQRNTTADDVGQTGGHRGGNNGAKEGALAWNARYLPDEPLVVVADHAAPSDGAGRTGAMERPVSLPVRRLKPPATPQESKTVGAGDVIGVGEETDIISSAGFCAGAHTAHSPPSVLDADLGLSPPCSPQPESPPFFANSSSDTASRSFSSGYRYHPRVPRGETLSEDGEVTDGWDEEVDDESNDEMTVSSDERSVRGDFTASADDDHNEDDDDTSVEEELLQLASKAAPADEVDRKADEFIAKFREQIRLQRL